jgi:hypothetical protein
MTDVNSSSQPAGAGQISPDGNYIWDGRAWQPRSQVSGQAGPGYGYQQQPPPQKKSHTLRNVLLVLLALSILFIGGCLALVGTAVNEVDKEIKRSQAEDTLPGGPDNPLEITPGESFEVYGFKYQAGWELREDVIGDAEIVGLKFKNERDEADSLFADVRITKGNELVAEITCTSDEAEIGQIVTVTCISTDDMPADYDKITIQDTF